MSTKKTTTPRYQSISGVEAHEMRRLAGKNQTQFWTRFGVTQSGASRYESGRSLPRPVRMLVVLAEGSTPEQIQILKGLGIDLNALAQGIIAADERAKASAAKKASNG